jgi:hypothetical protein
VIKTKFFLLLFTIALIVGSLWSPPRSFAAAPGSLGIGVEVLKATAAEDTTLGADGSLWFILPPGQAGTRSFRVNSVANIPMHMSVSLGFGEYRDGKPAFDDSKNTDIAAWVTFSQSEFSLSSGASKVVSITFNVPKNAQIKANLATVFVKGLGQNVASNKSGFSVGGAARVAIPVFLGVGTATQISINFKILSTSIKNIDGKRLAFIRIKNVGKTPVAPTGFIKVQAQEGSISIPDPIKVQSSTVIPGEEKDVIFLIPAFIPNGRWTFMEEFQQGSVWQTAQADIALTKPSIFTKANIFRFLIFLLSITILYFSLSYLRRPKQDNETPQEEDLMELDLALETIRKKNLRAKSAKRAPVKKSTVKKISVQKKTVNELPVKKVAKKKATKKAVTKKN